MKFVCTEPLSWETLIAYQLGELDEPRTASVEEHYFTCALCAERLASLDELSSGVKWLVSRGKLSASVSAAFVDAAAAKGMKIRRYAVRPGEGVACTAAPDDDFVALFLGIDAAARGRVDVVVDWINLDSKAHEHHVVEDVAIDGTTDQVVLLFAGDQIREFPRSHWTMEALLYPAEGQKGEPQRLGPYELNHTPWEQLPPA